jgi:hypothetical protein
VSEESGIGAQLETFREMRRTLEASVLPLATSVDGRRFSYQASLYDLELRIGGYVVLEGDGIARLGQVLTLELDQLSTEVTLPARAGIPEIPENVLSQADNLVLLRLNSLADAAFAEAAFSFVPPSLIERSVIFRQGKGLIAGKISPQPALLRFGARITQEGGADVPATWATPAD